MKKLSLLLCFPVLLTTAKAQIGLQDGMEWYYSMEEQIDFNAWIENYNYCWIEGDTTIQGKACKIFHRTHITCANRPVVEYLYEENNKWYFLDFISGQFKLLYDFTAQIGDTLTLGAYYFDDDPSFQDSQFYALVLDIDTIEFNGQPLKRFEVNYDFYYDEQISLSTTPSNNPDYIIEGIGATRNFLHYVEGGSWSCHYKRILGLRCFESDVLGLIKFDDIACDSIVVSSYEPKLQKELRIFPNPAFGELNLQSEVDIPKARLQLFDLSGRKVMEETLQLHAYENRRFNLNGIENGLYILNLSDENGRLLYAEKLLVR